MSRNIIAALELIGLGLLGGCGGGGNTALTTIPTAHLAITLPAATEAPSPTVTGATNAVSDPMKTCAPMVVRCLNTPS